MRTRLLAATLVALLACRGPARHGAGGLPADAPARTRRVNVPDMALHTVEVGQPRGSLRVAIHGGPGLDHTYLRPWLDPLGAQARLVYVDLRGHGRSNPPADASGYGITAAASDLSALIAQLGDGGPADVIAHDFGAEVALELAALHPEHVRRLVLIAPLWQPRQVRAIGPRSREQLGEAGWQRVQALTTPQGTLRDPRSVTELFRRLGVMWWHRPPAEAVLARMGRDMRYNAVADEHFIAEALVWDGSTRAAEVRAPTLVVAGTDDRTFSVEEARSLAERLPHGRLAEVAGAGHCPFIEQPDRFAALVGTFLRRSSGPE